MITNNERELRQLLSACTFLNLLCLISSQNVCGHVNVLNHFPLTALGHKWLKNKLIDTTRFLPKSKNLPLNERKNFKIVFKKMFKFLHLGHNFDSCVEKLWWLIWHLITNSALPFCYDTFSPKQQLCLTV